MSVANTASRMATGVQPRYLANAAGVMVLSTISLTTALALNDTFNLMQLPSDPADPNGKGPTIMGMLLDVDRLDSGSPAITLDIGDPASYARFYSAVTTAQAGGVALPNVAATIGYQPLTSSFDTYTTASLTTYTIAGKVHAAATTPQAGTLRLAVTYTYDP